MPAAPAMRLGFIGIGKMGSAMSSNLLKAGYKLFICDTNPDAVKEFATKQGAQIVETPRDLGAIPGNRHPADRAKTFDTKKDNICLEIDSFSNSHLRNRSKSSN
jgi:hypothetical protein